MPPRAHPEAHTRAKYRRIGAAHFSSPPQHNRAPLELLRKFHFFYCPAAQIQREQITKLQNFHETEDLLVGMPDLSRQTASLLSFVAQERAEVLHVLKAISTGVESVFCQSGEVLAH